MIQNYITRVSIHTLYVIIVNTFSILHYMKMHNLSIAHPLCGLWQAAPTSTNTQYYLVFTVSLNIISNMFSYKNIDFVSVTMYNVSYTQFSFISGRSLPAFNFLSLY